MVIGLLICLFPLFSTHYLLSLDGPTHLYNAAIYDRLAINDSFSSTYFEINPELVPNYCTHLILSGLLGLFNGAVSLKIFHILFIVAFLGGFYYWNLNRSNQHMSLVIALPFVYSTVFLNGFYNFSIGLALLFFTIGYYERSSQNIKRYLILTALLLVVYFSHSLAFVFCGAVLIVYEVHASIVARTGFLHLLKQLSLLAVSALIPLTLSVLFLDHRAGSNYYIPFNQLLSDLYSGFALVTRSNAAGIAKVLFLYSLVAVLILTARKRLKSCSGNYLLWTSILFLSAYFILPDSVGYAGVFSVRYSFFFWLLIAAWVARNLSPEWWKKTIVWSLASVFLLFQVGAQWKHWKELDNDASLLLEAQQHLPEHSIVYPVFASGAWNHFHLSNLLGVDKNVLILENNGARNDYFPVRYREDYEQLLQAKPSFIIESKKPVSIDYVVKIGKNEPDFHQTDIILMQGAEQNGNLVFENALVEVWSVK